MKIKVRMLKAKMLAELEASLLELEKSVNIARQNLNEQKNIPDEVFKRLDQYLDLIQTQKKLAEKLSKATSMQEIIEISNKINVLSKMIADDSTELLSSLIHPDKEGIPDKKTYINC